MTAKELAALLNGRKYLEEITAAEERQAKESGLLVVFGASDWRKAEPGTIRYALANRNGPMAENAVHGSDSEASARREIAIAFPPIGYSIAGGAPAPQPRRPGAMAEMA
jgi:hypothetical protein